MSQKVMQDEATKRRIEFLRNIVLFSQLSDKELITLLDDLRVKEYRRDEVIFRQGDESRELYIVLKGKIRIFKVSPAGNETSIVIFSDKDVIGEQAAIDGEPRNATAKAISAVSLLVMSHERFQYHLHAMHKLALGLVHLLNQKFRWTAAYAESVAQYDAAGRLLHTILLYNDQYGVQKDDMGKHFELELSLNQTDLASVVGARREWVNRILRDWRKRGLLEYRNGVITIFDLERVKAERDSRIEADHGQGEW